MTVYVDNLQNYPVTPRGMNPWCHMWADTEDELHEMANKIGLKREWYQDHHNWFGHYDLMASKRELAIKNGAVEGNIREVIRQKLRERSANSEKHEY